MMQLSLPYSTGYMQSTISWICDFSRCFMKSLSWMASLMRSLDLEGRWKAKCQTVLVFGLFYRGKWRGLKERNLVGDQYSLMPINKYWLALYEVLLFSVFQPQVFDFQAQRGHLEKASFWSEWRKTELKLSWEYLFKETKKNALSFWSMAHLCDFTCPESGAVLKEGDVTEFRGAKRQQIWADWLISCRDQCHHSHALSSFWPAAQSQTRYFQPGAKIFVSSLVLN